MKKHDLGMVPANNDKAECIEIRRSETKVTHHPLCLFQSMRRGRLKRILLAALLPQLCFPEETQARSSSEQRIAVCFWGLTRSLWATRDSLRNAVLDPLLGKGFRVEKYVHTYQLDHERGQDLAWESYRWLNIPDSHVILEKT